jgi:SHS2 domain-containing protein
MAHVADVILSFHADTAEEVFIEAARAVARWGRGRTEGDLADVTVRLEAPDRATLLADWINELLGLSEIQCAAFACVEAVLVGSTLTARLRGARIAAWRCPWKAATYHDLRFERRRGRWRARVLCDT